MRLSDIRKRGVIPSKRHDAFLLSLLLAVLTNVLFFAIQGLLPAIILLLTLLGLMPPPQIDAEKLTPFELIDPALLDLDQLPFVIQDATQQNEELSSELPPDATGIFDQEARQTQPTPDLPEGSAFIPEGVDIIMTVPGLPGPELPPGNAEENAYQPEQAEAPQTPTPPEEASEAMEMIPPEPEPLPEPSPEPSPEPEPYEPAEATQPDAFSAVFEEEIVRLDDPFTAEDLESAISPILLDAERQTQIREDVIELAALPASPDQFSDPSQREIERLARQPFEQPAPRPPERLPRPEPAREMRQPEPPAAPQPARPASEANEPSPERPPRPQPVFRRIGGDSGQAGAPAHRQTETSVRLIGEDASMRILQHRYGAYMAKVGRQLQQSLNRQMIMSPLSFSTGQIKLRFGIAPDGSLSFYETVFVRAGMESERIMSERMLQEAAPFDPLTAEMQADPNFQNLTVVVNLM